MDNIIRVRVDKHYGRTFIYALDYAKELETLTGLKTLTPSNIEALKGLGFGFTQVVNAPCNINHTLDV